ncbi:hypothetical protein BKA93DRAFT_821379 [Sparassis latifolia]
MRFGVRNVYYLRISASTVIPLYLYLDERHVEWMSERVLQHVLADLRPQILQKLIDEADAQLGPGGPANAKRGSVDVHRGDTYQFGYFLRKMEPHSVLIKTRHFVPAPDPPPPAVKEPSKAPSPEPSTQKRRKRPAKKPSRAKNTKRPKTKGKQRARDTDEEDEPMVISSDDDEDQISASPSVPAPPRRSARARKLVAGGYHENEDINLDEQPEIADGDGDVEMVVPNEEPIVRPIEPGDHPLPSGLDDASLITIDEAEDTPTVPVKHEVAEPALSELPPTDITVESPLEIVAEFNTPAIEPALVPDETDSKQKLQLQLRYQGFNIQGRCLCVIVEPYPPIRAPSRAPSLTPMGLVGPRARSIAPPDFVPSGASQRERTPLFLPEYDRERTETPAPSMFPRSLPPVPLFYESAPREDSDDEGGSMLSFSQVLRSHQAITVEDDDEMDGSVLFGDADERKEM